MVDLLRYFLLQLVLHNWFNRDSGMYCPVCEMVHIKDSLLADGMSSLGSGGRGFPLSLSE